MTPTPAITACIPNIGPGERQKRRVIGIILLAVAVAILATLVAIGAGRWWRLGLLLPFLGSAIGFFQAREKT